MKNGSGACGTGAAPSEPDVTFVMKDNNFQKMFAGNFYEVLTIRLLLLLRYFNIKIGSKLCIFSGKLKPTTAFMTGKMKIQGDMGKAMKLEKLMGKMQQRGYHTMPNHQRGKL